VDQHVLGQHRAVDHPGPVRGADRGQQAPPHPRRVARIDSRREGGPYVGEAAETAERADQVDVPPDTRTGVITLPRRHQRREVGEQSRVHRVLEPGQRRGLAAHQVVVRRVSGHLQQPAPHLVQIGDVALVQPGQ